MRKSLWAIQSFEPVSRTRHATVTKGGTLPDTGVTKNEVYALVDSATVTAIVNADISAAAAIADAKLAQITTASKVSAAAVTGLIGSINFIIDGGGSAVTTGVKGDVEVPFACVLNRATLIANASCTAAVNIYKDTYANYPAALVDSIINASLASLPTITLGIKYQDANLTNWNVSIAAGEILRYVVDSNDNATQLAIALKYSRTVGNA